jgi:hypothetical protein
MPLPIDDPATERLIDEVARRTGTSRVDAIRAALEQRLAALDRQTDVEDRARRLQRYLEREVWTTLPIPRPGPVTKAERERILGIGPDGF